MSNILLHPILLQFKEEKEQENNPIIPKLNINNEKKQYVVPYKVNNFSFFSKSIITNQNLNNFNLSLYLLIHFNIENIDYAIIFLNNIIEKNIKIETINFITNNILYNFHYLFYEIIYIDKMIFFYKNFFLKFYNKEFKYDEIFKIFNNVIDNTIQNNFIKKIIHTNFIKQIINIK